jgi:hypothetical protein
MNRKNINPLLGESQTRATVQGESKPKT